LITRKRIRSTANLDALDMLALFESGVPLKLGEGKQLFLGTVRNDSPLVGNSLDQISNSVLKDSSQVMAVFRGRQALLPRPDVTMRENDRLLLHCSPDVRDQLAGDLAFEEGGIQPDSAGGSTDRTLI
jgi:NhaP-type Na+/H+ and K+/H+ antiporter